MKEIRFVDTTYRDGHASLWAEGMTTGMMLPGAEAMDRAGFVAMEVIGTSHFKKCVRELREDPWQRIRLLAERIRNTELVAMNGHNAPNTFAGAPLAVIELWLHRLAANGIQRLHLMEPSNDMGERVRAVVGFARSAGLKVTMALIYTLSPRHTDEYYVQKLKDALALGVDTVYLKDPGGLLTPERVRTLVPALLDNAGEMPLQLHSHCTTGLAPLCYLDAMRLGMRTFHTALPPLANGSSQPSLFNVARNARSLGFDTLVDEAAVRPVSEHLTRVAAREGLPAGVPLEYDHAQYVHQVPGGVISNLRHQLEQMGMGERLPEVLAETVRVRRELGYPIMVTPFSQFVVSQATIHVLQGERYEQVTDELIKYGLGLWGEEASSRIDAGVRDRILGRRRAKEIAEAAAVEPTLEEVRGRLGGRDVSDDELLLRFIMGGASEVDRMRAAPRPAGNHGAGAPLIDLIRGVATARDIRYVSLSRNGLSLELRPNG